MQRIICFFILVTIKIVSMVFWRLEYKWLNPTPPDPWKKAKMIVLMNHTSLFEPIYVQAFSFSYLWYLSARMNVPGADITLNRPIVGRFWKMMVPNIVAVTRRNDGSWAR